MMPELGTTFEKGVAMLHGFCRRHWQRTLILRDRFWLSEEALHLFLAAGVGVLGGVANLSYLWLNRLIQWSALGDPGELLEVARSAPKWHLLFTPALGGLAAGAGARLGLAAPG